MAVNLNSESALWKFVIISDKPKPSKNNFIEKPSNDKDKDMSTKSSTPPNSNENSMDEKKPTNSQETMKQTVSEAKANDIPKNNGDLAKEQKDEKSSHSVQNSLSIEVPSETSKSSSPQHVTSPSELKPPETSTLPSSPSIKTSFKNVGKKLGNMIRNSSDNGSASNKVPEQKETATVTSESTDQVQQERQIVNSTESESISEGSNSVTNNSTENTEGSDKIDENQKTPGTEAVKSRTNSLSKFANMKLFITRTSSVLVEKSKEVFDELDKRIYPDIDHNDKNLVEENEAKLNNRSVTINEREELFENKDTSSVSKNNEITNSTSQKVQSTQSALADVAIALNERKEKLDNIGEKTEELSNNSLSFAEMAAQIRKNQEQKNKSWKFWQ